MNIDVTVYVDGYHGDTSRTLFVGDVVSFNTPPDFLPLFITSRIGRTGAAAS